jgi:hypothetical protein
MLSLIAGTLLLMQSDVAQVAGPAGLDRTDCAANGTCCPEHNSVCVWGPGAEQYDIHYYWKGPGKCGPR